MNRYKYLSLIGGIFTATLVITNLLNTKIFVLWGFSFPAGIITFPVTFLAADALTEVYGYKVTRQVIWAGFASLLFMVAAVTMAVALPPAGFWTGQAAFASVLAQVPRIVTASILAYWSGEFCNSYVLAKAKVRSGGSFMGFRFIGSTMVGQAVDTLMFMTIAFLGVFPPGEMVTLFISSWVFKVLWEVIALPVSIPFTNWLKRVEGEDVYDKETNFTPFSMSV